MAVPIYDDDQIDSRPAAAAATAKNGELSPITAAFVQFYIETQQHQLDHKQLAALKAWRKKYLQTLKQKQHQQHQP